MNPRLRNNVGELQGIISKVPLHVCCVTVLPEFGIRWRDLARAVRKARLPMTPTSVARILCRQVAQSLEPEEIKDIVTKLRLKLIATQRRTWHVIKLLEHDMSDEPINILSYKLPLRLRQTLKASRACRNMNPEVQTVRFGDLIYISVQLISSVKEGGILYLAVPPGEDVALVSSVSSNLLGACVQGLGYKTYEDACLNGRDIYSLLQMYNSNYTEHVDHLAAMPEYTVAPCVTRGGIDFTGRAADELYAKQALGPNPPKLSMLSIQTEKQFFNPDILNKKMKVQIKLKSENVAGTLQSWAAKGAILPTSELLTTFRKIKSNKICINSDEE